MSCPGIEKCDKLRLKIAPVCAECPESEPERPAWWPENPYTTIKNLEDGWMRCLPSDGFSRPITTERTTGSYMKRQRVDEGEADFDAGIKALQDKLFEEEKAKLGR